MPDYTLSNGDTVTLRDGLTVAETNQVIDQYLRSKPAAAPTPTPTASPAPSPDLPPLLPIDPQAQATRTSRLQMAQTAPNPLTEMGVGPGMQALYSTPVIGPVAAGAVGSVTGLVGNVEMRLGRFLGIDAWSTGGERLIREANTISDAALTGQSPVMEAFGQQLGGLGAQAALFGGLGRVAGLETGASSTLVQGAVEGAKSGLKLQAGMKALDLAGARPGERPALLAPGLLAEEFGAAAAWGGAGGIHGYASAKGKTLAPKGASGIDPAIKDAVLLEKFGKPVAYEAAAHGEALDAFVKASDEALRIAALPATPANTAALQQAMAEAHAAQSTANATRVEVARQAALYAAATKRPFDWATFEQQSGVSLPPRKVMNLVENDAQSHAAAYQVALSMNDTRIANAASWGATTQDPGELARQLTSDVKALGDVTIAVTRDDVEQIKPAGSAHRVLASMGDAISNFGKDVAETFAKKNARSIDFQEEMVAAIGRRNSMYQYAEDIRPAMREAVKSVPARELLRVVFDPEGKQRIEVADAARAAAGQPVIMTPKVEALVDYLRKGADGAFGLQAAVGKIGVEAFQENYLPQFYKDVQGAREWLRGNKGKMTMTASGGMERGQFGLERIYGSIFEAAEKSGGKLQLKSYDVADIIPNLLSAAADATLDGEVRLLAESKGAIIAHEDLVKLPFEKRKQFHPLPAGDYVHNDVWRVAKGIMGDGRWTTSPEKWLGAIKNLRFSIDYQHITQLGRSLIAHPDVAFNPMAWYRLMTGATMRSPRVMEAVREGALRLDYAGGDAEALYRGSHNALRSIIDLKPKDVLPEKLRDMFPNLLDVSPLHASHRLIFKTVATNLKAMIAHADLTKAFDAKAAGDNFYGRMTDRQIYQHVAKNVESWFGNLDMTRRGLHPQTQRALRAIFAAPDWNLSILRNGVAALQEVGAFAAGKPTDLYNSKRFISMMGATALLTGVTNSQTKKAWGTDYNPTDDLFSLVLPFKDPRTGKNIRLATLGPQFQFWKSAYNVANYTLTTHGAKVPEFAWAFGTEIARTIGNKAHFGWAVPARLLTDVPRGKASAKDIAGTIAAGLGPMSSDDLSTYFREMSENELSASSHVKTKLVGLFTGVGHVEHDLPTLLKADFDASLRDYHNHSTNAYWYGLEHDMKGLAAKETQAAVDAQKAFVGRWQGTKYWPLVAPLMKNWSRRPPNK